MTRSKKKAPRQPEAKAPKQSPLPWAIGTIALAILYFSWSALDKKETPEPDQSKTDTVTAPAGPAPVAFKLEPDAEVFALYAGSESCKDCHAEIHATWAASHHGRAERLPNAKDDFQAFEPPQTFTHGTQTSTAQLKDNKPEVVTLGLQGKQPFPVQRVIGETPLRQYLVDAPGNRLQTLEVALDPRTNEWFNVYGDEDRRPGEWGHWTGRGMTWNNMCAGCHNTRLRKHYDALQDAYNTTMAEMSVGCEACHGPMKDHGEWYSLHPETQPFPGRKTFTRDQQRDTCGTCHSRRAELTGDFKPGDDYNDHFSLVIPNETDIYFADGQVRDEDYVFTSFLSSGMHTAGVRCNDCHEPHSHQLRLPGNLMCLSCHAGQNPLSPRIDPGPHSHHDPNGAGGQCANCHMPQTTYMQRDPRRDHSFSIPDPLLTRDLGIPNACNKCHADQTTDWAIEAVDKWYGDRMNRHTRDRARWVTASRNQEPGAHGNLIRMYREQTNQVWKAVATTLLRDYLHEPVVQTELLARLDHESPLVRGHALIALEPAAGQGLPNVLQAIRPLLQDPVRRVRVDAAWALRRELDPLTPAGQDLKYYLAFNADQPTGVLQQGVYELDRNQPKKALPYFHRAVAWDPNSAGLRHEYAIALSLAGQPSDAVRELETAVKLDPNEAEYSFKLGLGRNELGDIPGTAAALEDAVRKNPNHVQALYNLGLAYHAMSQSDKAVDVLLQAETIAPSAAHIAYARATILFQSGRIDEAQAAAERVLEIQPGHPEASNLIRMLSQRIR